MGLPKRVHIKEVGPREGFQFEKTVFATTEKLHLIESLIKTGLRDIEVCSFVRPDRVPQMADAEALVDALPDATGVKYTGIYFNRQGLDRALATKRLHIDPSLSVAASETFSKKNINCTLEESLGRQEERAAVFSNMGMKSVTIMVATAFGCNYEADVPFATVMHLLERLTDLAGKHEMTVNGIRLLDTMGWANPEQMIRAMEAVKGQWPGTPIGLHLHDTRGLGLINAYAALTCGVADFDTAIGGMGGCPFAGNRGASGNIATEDFVFLCHELGIQTDVDLDKCIESALLAERIVGHDLPGKVKAGGSLASYRAIKRGAV